MAPASPLLTTKLYLPRARPNRVPRPHLSARLNQTEPIVLVAAPAGFGKTTLLAEWILTSPHCVTWLSLDEGDNDPTRFWQYVIAALQRLSPSLGASALAQSQTLPSPPMTAVLTTLINEIVDYPETFALVLDDYHAIGVQAVHEAVAHLLDHRPPNMRLVITARADPPLPLARLRARGELLELRASDLRFTSAEVAAFLRDCMRLQLAASEVAALEARTEGWAAGLQLAALSLQNREDIAGFVRAFSGSHRHVITYLAEEVLARRPPGTLEFLLQTSVLDRMCGPLCEAVTGETGGQATLEGLQQADLFVVPLDDEGRWYRYHHLFADVLRARLALAHPGLAPQLHRRASDWHAQNGHLEAAVRHALAAADLDRSANLIERAAEEMLNRGEHAAIQGWLAALPDDLVRSRPNLCLARATTLAMAFQLDEAETWLSAADQRADEQPESGSVLASRVAGLRGMVALLRRDAKTGIALTRQALQSLPAVASLQRGRLLMQLGMALLGQGDLAAAHPALSEASRVSAAADDFGSAVVALVGLGLALHLQGSLRQAAATYQGAFDLAGRLGLAHMPFVGLAHTRLAEVLCEWNELDAADPHLQQALQQGERSANLRVLLDACQVQARLRLARDDLAGSQHALDRAFALVRDHHMPPETAGGLMAQQVRLWLAREQLAAATAWAEASGLSPDDELGVTRAPVHRALVRVLLAQRALEPALRFLSRMKAALEAGGLVSGLVEVLALEAVAHSLVGNASDALAAAERAVALAEPEGYIRSFVDEGPLLRDLLLRLRATPLPPARQDYVARLLAAFGQTPPAPVLLNETLRDRELEVLRLIAEGYSNREIAERLVVGVSTVKTHINHLFQKLGVASRTQAIARGRELGLLN